jgi:hypothetical protein
MSILFFGGEMGAFVPSDSSSEEDTTSGSYDSGFARNSLEITGASSYVDSVGFTLTADLWIRFDVIQGGSSSNTAAKAPIVVGLNGSGTEVVRLTGDFQTAGGSITWQFQYLLSGTWTNLGSSFVTSTARQTFDIHLVVNSGSGSVEIFCSGTSRASGSADLSGISGIAKLRAYGRNVLGAATVSVSQVVVASEPTIDMRVGTIVMTGQGATHTFDTGGFANIDEGVYSDADFIQSGTAAQIELFTGTPVPSFTGYTIRALALTARANYSGSAPTKFRFVLRSAGTNYTSADQTLTFGNGAFCKVWETNPATSAAFNSSEISALQYGVESRT